MHEYTFKAIPFSFARRVTSAFFRFESLFMYLLLMLNIVTEFCALQGLFVVRTEDISRSNCIVHPQGVRCGWIALFFPPDVCEAVFVFNHIDLHMKITAFC